MGGTITALVAQKKKKDRVSVYLDGKFAFGLAALEALKLKRGQVLGANPSRALGLFQRQAQALACEAQTLTDGLHDLLSVKDYSGGRASDASASAGAASASASAANAAFSSASSAARSSPKASASASAATCAL